MEEAFYSMKIQFGKLEKEEIRNEVQEILAEGIVPCCLEHIEFAFWSLKM